MYLHRFTTGSLEKWAMLGLVARTQFPVHATRLRAGTRRAASDPQTPAGEAWKQFVRASGIHVLVWSLLYWS